MSWNILSIKKYLFIALAVGGLSLATSNIADARPNGPRIGKMLFKDLDLSAEQKAGLKQMRSEKKALKKELKKEFKGDRKDWMLGFINGETSRRSIHSDIDQKFDDKSEFHVQKITAMLDFIDDLNREQRTQLLENIERIQEKGEKRRAKRKDKRAEKMKKMKERGSFAQKLVEDISLNRNQSSLLGKIESKQEAMRAEHKAKAQEGPKGHLGIMEAFASGSKSRSSILRDHKTRVSDKRQHKHQMVDLWASLISTMDEDQKDQLVHNIETLREKRKERMQKRKERRKNRKERLKNRSKDRSEEGSFEREDKMESDFDRDDF